MSKQEEKVMQEVGNTPAAETALSTITQDGQAIVHQPQSVAEKLLSGAKGNFITSIKDDGQAATRAKIYNAISDNTASIRDMIGKTLEVTDLMAYPVSIVNADGEFIDGIRVVVITKDGSSYGSVSDGVFSSMQQIIAICGMPPWNGVKLTPVEKTTRRGFRTLTFRMEA